MIFVKPRIFKVKFLDGSSVYYGSLGKLTKALQSYPLEKLEITIAGQRLATIAP